MNSEVVSVSINSMDESKGEEIEGVRVRASVVSVETVIATETVISKIGSGGEVERTVECVGVSEEVVVEEEDGGACEVVDVMLKVLGSEVVFDGVVRNSGETGIGEIGRQDGDFGMIEDGGREVDEAVGGQDRVLRRRADDSTLCGEGNESSFGYSGSRYVEAYDVGMEKTIEVVVGEVKEGEMGDVGGQENVELLDNGTGLCENSSSHNAEGKCNDIGDSVPHPMSTIASTADKKMIVNEEKSLEILKGEDKTVINASVVSDARPREQDGENDGDEQAVSEVIPHGCGTVLEDETINEGQEEPVILDSMSGDLNYANSEVLDLHTQANIAEFMDGATECVPVSEPGTQMNDMMTLERPQFVIDEKSVDVSLTAIAGHVNGVLDEMKLDGTDMDIVAASGSLIKSENQPVDMKERGEDIENNVIKEETLVVGMDIDIVDAYSKNKGIICEASHDDLNDSSDNQVSGAVILVKCTGTSLVDYNTKSSDPTSSTAVDEQYVEVEGKMQNIEDLGTGSPVLDTEIPHISVTGNHIINLPVDSWQGEPSEGDTDKPPVLDESDTVQVVNHEPECGIDASHIGCLENHTAVGVHEFGSNIENLQEVHETVHSEQVSVGHDLPNEGNKGKLSNPLTLDAGGVALGGSTTKVVPDEPHEQAILLDASSNEDKTVEASDAVIATMNDVTELDSNLDTVQEVHEAVFTDRVLSMHESAVEDENADADADAFTQNNSNEENMEEVEEECNNCEGVVYTNNMAPNEGAKPSAVVDTQGEIYLVDENVMAGPFIVETEDPDESIIGSGYVDVELGPLYDENGGSDTHVIYEQLDLPFYPHAKGLAQEEADHDAKPDSDMEDAQDEQEEEEEVDEEHSSDSAKPRNKKDKNFSAYPKAGSLLKEDCVSYQLPLEMEGEFSVSDLVWGKVKSHPWWPGQIFHPSDSSKMAMKYFRKDCYLVAYFGDRSFAWNEASVLKPFRNHFSVAERQHKTESFQNAVTCALQEVFRRTELGLACSCVSQEAFDKIRYQIVENAGIREESNERKGVDRCAEIDYFQPDKLVEYARSLAIFPFSTVDRLELVAAKAQLSAFLRLKGIDALPEYQYYEGLEGISAQGDHQDLATRFESKITLKGPKRKHNLKDIVYQRRREKIMTELMGETMYYLDGEFDSLEEEDNILTSPTSGVKRKASGFDNFTKTISVAKVSQTASSNPQQSFKVGECIQRVASQLTGSSSVLKGGSDADNSEYVGDGAGEVMEAPDDDQTEMSPGPSQQSSLDEMLSQLHLCAQDPMKGYSFLGDIILFFTDFRNLAVTTQRQQLRKKPGRKQKSSAPVVGTPETFEFDDRNDSYWKEMVVQNNAEARPARRSRKRKDGQVMSVDSEKPSQSKPRKSSRKQYFHGPLGSTVEMPLGDAGQQKQLPTELMLIFNGMGSIPSEMNLNKMFRCFGPLKETETEIDSQSSRARLVFKKRSDAEVAYSSAAMFNIFGSTLVNYQLNYTPSVSFKTVLPALTDSQEKAT